MSGKGTRFACCPRGIAPGIAYLIAEGYLNFGGGEKNVPWLIPWLAWSVLYAVLFVIFWVKGLLSERSFASAAGGATVLRNRKNLVPLVVPEHRGLPILGEQ